MKRFQVRDDGGQGEFEILSARVIEARTRGFVVKTVVFGVMVALLLTVAVLAARGDVTGLTATATVMSNLLSFVLGRYFDKGKDG